MNSRTLIISDIHGCYDEFNSLLELVGYQPNEDKLILLGDYVDRGSQSKEVIEQIISMVRQHGVIALRGNHDQRLIDVIQTEDSIVISKFFEHGGIETLRSYCPDLGTDKLDLFRDYIKNNYPHHLEFLNELPFYYEDTQHIYVHAGLNPAFQNWKEQSKHDFMYIKEPFFNHRTKTDKVVVFGHTKTKDIHQKAGIWFGGDKIGIDGGCAFGLQLNCLEIRNGKEYGVYSVKSNISK